MGSVEGEAWEYAHKIVNPGSHYVYAPDGTPFGIVSLGYDEDVSYGYPGGAGLEGISVPPPVPVG